MNQCVKVVLVTGMFFLIPWALQAQSLASSIDALHGVLFQMYQTMIQKCTELIGVATSIAAFASTMYIGYRVWRHIANAEPIDFFPLFRPFVLSLCILNFTRVLDVINGLMQPVTETTAGMVQNSNATIKSLLAQKQAALMNTAEYQMYVGANGNGDYDKWYQYTNQQPDGLFGAMNEISFYSAKMMYSFKNSIKVWLSEILNVLYEAAALCVDCIRTFQLVVMAILGPLVFALAVFDGFQHTLTAWLARYINIFLWLPVANLFGTIIGSIQEQMIQLDIQQIQASGSTSFSGTDTAYIIFLIIGIIGYTTVPSIASYIVNAGGGGALLTRTTTIASSSVSSVTGRAGQGVSNIMTAGRNYQEGYSGKNEGQGAAATIGSSAGYAGSYMKDKLAGSSSDEKKS
jgi:conjugative transposon TraJ protein